MSALKPASEWATRWAWAGPGKDVADLVEAVRAEMRTELVEALLDKRSAHVHLDSYAEGYEDALNDAVDLVESFGKEQGK